jgi:hypothetical protein
MVEAVITEADADGDDGVRKELIDLPKSEGKLWTLVSATSTEPKHNTAIRTRAVEILTNPDPVKAAQTYLDQETPQGQNFLQRLIAP